MSMEKKQYMMPSIDVRLLSTMELMKTGGTSPNLPPDPNAVPRRRTEVF